jgi:thiol-disulfide isomerase/thioredoxin
MPLTETQLKVIKLLAEHEKAISQLYREYARKFPEQKDFWSKIAAEEIEHASWIFKLRSQAEKGSLYFKEGRFKIEAIKTSLEYVKSQITEAQNNKISAKNALSVARDLESGLIEKKFFEIFEPDCREIKQVLLDLAAATREHYNRIEKVWNNEIKF